MQLKTNLQTLYFCKITNTSDFKLKFIKMFLRGPKIQVKIPSRSGILSRERGRERERERVTPPSKDEG